MNWPVAELIPHAGEMVLLDELVSCDEERVHARLRVRPGLLSQADGSLPAWAGVEFMAQAVAAYAGYRTRSAGEPVKLGFLLGTRKYSCNVDAFPVDTLLDIHASSSLQDENGMGVFECLLLGPGIRAEARLNVFCPPDSGEFLQE